MAVDVLCVFVDYELRFLCVSPGYEEGPWVFRGGDLPEFPVCQLICKPVTTD